MAAAAMGLSTSRWWSRIRVDGLVPVLSPIRRRLGGLVGGARRGLFHADPVRKRPCKRFHDLTKGITPNPRGDPCDQRRRSDLPLGVQTSVRLRSGRKAYDEERGGEQLLDIERAATSR